MNPTSSSIESLPAEIQVQVFSYLPIETLAITSRVSQKWNSISNCNNIWKPLCCKHFSNLFKIKLAISDDSIFKEIFKVNVICLLSLVYDNQDITIHGLKDGIRIFSEEFLNCLVDKKTSLEQLKAIRAYANTPFHYIFDIQTRLWTVCEEAFPKHHGLQNLNTMKILLQCGANPNYIHDTFYCPTALFVAAMRAEKEAVQLLLEFGADPKIKNIANETAYDVVGKDSWYGATQDDKTAIRKLLENQKT